ncbi:MAG: ferritin-like domain-containing protein [Actinomycetota bacterium]|nr:ferritin-like domain-containing protein [Actinomycetota bacterium]
MTQATRAQFLSRGAKGGIALVAGSSLLAVTSGEGFAAMGAATDDVAIAKLAATAELLAMDFYTRALKSKQITKSDELGYMSSALANEKAHYAALKGVLKGATPAGVKFKYPAGAFASRKSIGQLGMALETAFVGAYMGAVTALESNALKGVAAEIGACESRHLSVLSNIGANQIVPAPDLPKVLTAAQATAALKPFFA